MIFPFQVIVILNSEEEIVRNLHEEYCNVVLHTC
jgi:hypothetical protein